MRALFDHTHVRFRTTCFDRCLLDVSAISDQDNGFTLVGHRHDDAGAAGETRQPANVLARRHDEPCDGAGEVPASQTVHEETVVGRIVEWFECLEACHLRDYPK